MRTQPYARRAKHKSVRPKSRKPKEAKEIADGGDSITALGELIDHGERMSFECVIPHDIGTSEQLAADVLALKVIPKKRMTLACAVCN